MTVSSLSNIGLSQADKNATSSASSQQLAANLDTFLTLLTTQLKNQDPTSPMETDKFTDQLSQFAQVEQGIQTNQNLEDLLSMQEQQRQLSALSYVGARIEAVGDTSWLEKDGSIDFKYNVSPADVPQVELQIVNQDGDTVYSKTVSDKSGLQDFSWDGKSNSGVAQPEGAYTLVVKPKDGSGNTYADKSGKPAEVYIGISGIVESVDIADDGIYLRIGGVSVPFETLTNVKLGANGTPTNETPTDDEEQDQAA